MNRKERKAGLIAGISLVIMAIAAGFSYGYVHNKLVNESAEITMQNLIENKLLFMAGISGWIIIFITDLLVSGSLFIFFKNRMRRFSLLTAITRVIYTLVLGAAVFQLISMLPLLKSGVDSSEIVLHIVSFERIWSAGLIIFGLHLIGLGYLSFKSRTIPVVLAFLLYLAGAGYIVIHMAKQFGLFSHSVISSIENIMALPMALGELLLAVWLIYLGLKKQKS
jgi:hypothetical protein